MNSVISLQERAKRAIGIDPDLASGKVAGFARSYS
jgi:hypothetical protein